MASPFEELSAATVKALSSDEILGAHGLDRLAKLAYNCLSVTDSGKQAVAYVLYCFFGRASYCFSDRMVPNEESKHFSENAIPAIRAAIHYLNEGKDLQDAIAVINELTRADQMSFPR